MYIGTKNIEECYRKLCALNQVNAMPESHLDLVTQLLSHLLYLFAAFGSRARQESTKQNQLYRKTTKQNYLLIAQISVSHHFTLQLIRCVHEKHVTLNGKKNCLSQWNYKNIRGPVLFNSHFQPTGFHALTKKKNNLPMHCMSSSSINLRLLWRIFVRPVFMGTFPRIFIFQLYETSMVKNVFQN